MRLRLIRNATLVLEYAGRRLLLDPYFASRFSRPSYAGRSANPLVDLPLPPEEILDGAQALLVSHLHSDHFDPEAQRLLPKELPLFCQPGDETVIREKGFTRVEPVRDSLTWEGIRIAQTPGQHGSGQVLEEMGRVSGFVFQAKGEPTLYWAGDTILYPAVLETIQRFRPQVIVVHAGGAVWGAEQTRIIMDAAQAVEVCQAAPSATVIATHLEALDHCLTTRAELRGQARAAGISDKQLLIPRDGQWLDL